jgi:hypothetical protein
MAAAFDDAEGGLRNGVVQRLAHGDRGGVVLFAVITATGIVNEGE